MKPAFKDEVMEIIHNRYYAACKCVVLYHHILGYRANWRSIRGLYKAKPNDGTSRRLSQDLEKNLKLGKFRNISDALNFRKEHQNIFRSNQLKSVS